MTKKRGILKKLNKEEELLSHIKMAHEIITFGYIEVEKHKFHYSKYPININNTNIEKVISYPPRFHYVKIVLNTLLVTKMMKTLSHYVQCFQK